MLTRSVQGGTLTCSRTGARVRSRTRRVATRARAWCEAWCMDSKAVKAPLALLGVLVALRARGPGESAESRTLSRRFSPKTVF